VDARAIRHHAAADDRALGRNAEQSAPVTAGDVPVGIEFGGSRIERDPQRNATVRVMRVVRGRRWTRRAAKVSTRTQAACRGARGDEEG
jgi:hypothetical protein